MNSKSEVLHVTDFVGILKGSLKAELQNIKA
jgi:hypothetical protein